MSFDSNRDFIISRSSSAVEIDEGLRQYMLKVYNYMTIGLLITAGVSYLLANSGLGEMFFSPEIKLNRFIITFPLYLKLSVRLYLKTIKNFFLEKSKMHLL